MWSFSRQKCQMEAASVPESGALAWAKMSLKTCSDFSRGKISPEEFSIFLIFRSIWEMKGSPNPASSFHLIMSLLSLQLYST